MPVAQAVEHKKRNSAEETADLGSVETPVAAAVSLAGSSKEGNLVKAEINAQA